jgi:hypothetical protein
MQKPHSSIPEYQLLLHMGGVGSGWGRRPLLHRGRGVGPVPTTVLGRGVEVLPAAAPERGVGASPAAAPGMGPAPDVVPRRGCRRRLMLRWGGSCRPCHRHRLRTRRPCLRLLPSLKSVSPYSTEQELHRVNSSFG